MYRKLAVLCLAAVIFQFFSQTARGAGATGSDPDAPYEELLPEVRDLYKPIQPFARSALASVTASAQLDDIDRALLDFMIENLTGGGPTSSDLFMMQQKVNAAYRFSQMIDSRTSQSSAARGQAAFAANLNALSAQMEVENMKRKAAERRRNYIRLRCRYKQGYWQAALDKEPMTEIDHVLLARAHNRALQAGMPFTDDRRRTGMLEWADTFGLINATPVLIPDRAVLYREAGTWYRLATAGASAIEQKKLADIWLKGAVGYLRSTQDSMSDEVAVSTAQDCAELALKAGDVKMFTDLVDSLEHPDSGKVGGYGGNEAFLLAGLYLETKGDRRQAAEFWRAYLDEFAGFNLTYRSRARYLGVAERKLAELGDPGKRANRFWGVSRADRAKAAAEAEKDIKRKDMGLDF